MRKVEIVDDRGEKFEAELADSFLSRAKGLSFRSSGKMLFAFPGNTRSSIDMMFLSKPLHLYFMDSEKKVIDVKRAEPWSLDPWSWKLYSPEQSYRYLLESFEELDIEEGDALSFDI
ncbi:MAG: DUF192 domain-containing protein [Candidatus Nanohaloarchaea archaeon]